MECSHPFLVSFLIIILMSTSSHFRLFNAEGRKLAQTGGDISPKTMKDGKTIWRAQVGSRPPRCERRCSSCAHCEAIQVPTTNQQVKSRIQNSITAVDATTTAGDHENSNYKPMSWKCKCGDLIFNP